ncbi:peptidoglycan editing factor PgeF [Carboxydocella sp. ULO1]|uniref:peptidoglycan editing factor PgeF n=1 Tax=Carboxydocella sp. ULO1 TaxID=1926599 RepID=UPI0009CBB4D9|nr:peptidoglycan editing factor PgeF [Carboxydocella sp. ULO1]GAW28130.1 multicopper polyphenol oxidase [Carboxydocella sp. ULO1]
MEPFQLRDKGGVVHLALPDWEPWAQVAFSTRIGGTSKPPYNTLNLGLHVGDESGRVIVNRKRFAQSLGLEADALVSVRQVHGCHLVWAGAARRGQGAFSWDESLQAADALATAERGLPLITFYADCVPLYFLAPEGGVVAMAHAGWQGTVQQIGPLVVRELCQQLELAPEQIWVAIGPHIGPCCYEVDERVALKIEALGVGGLTPGREGHWQLDLGETNRQLLLQAGIKPENVWQSRYCTACHSDLFFSHRKSGGKTGRMGALIMLK